MDRPFSETDTTMSPSQTSSVTPPPVNASPITSVQKRKSFVPFLLLILLSQVVLLLWFAKRDPVASAWLQSHLAIAKESPSIAPVRPFDASLDPPLQSVLPTGSGLPDLHKSSLPDAHGHLVVYVGDCATCANVDLPQWEKEAKARHLSLLLLTSGDAKSAETFRKSLSLKTPVFSDPRRQLLRRLNAVWSVRTYFYSPQWKLEWIQPQVMPGYNPFQDLSCPASRKGVK